MEYIRSYTDPIMKLDILQTTEKKTTEEADKIMKKYPDRIPAIVDKNPKSTNTPDIDKHKYLVPIDLTMGQLMYVIRKRIKLGHEQALFLFVNGSVASNSELVSSVYYRSHDPEDRFLHIVYSCENVFGSFHLLEIHL
jgi:GABA(A) receptor-associated protein